MSEAAEHIDIERATRFPAMHYRRECPHQGRHAVTVVHRLDIGRAALTKHVAGIGTGNPDHSTGLTQIGDGGAGVGVGVDVGVGVEGTDVAVGSAGMGVLVGAAGGGGAGADRTVKLPDNRPILTS